MLCFLDKIRSDSEQQIADLTIQVQEETAKFMTSQECIKELREQLDDCRREASELTETVKKYEADSFEYRKDRNKVIDERDSLAKMVERRDFEIERLENDIATLNQQLTQSINARTLAQAKYDEIQYREADLDFKEKSMAQEKKMMKNQIESLESDLNRNISELHALKREAQLKNVTIETRLQEKTEELKIASSTIAHLTESNNSLSNSVEELNLKLLKQGEESYKMIEQYKKELASQTRLMELYKENSDDSKSEVTVLTDTCAELRGMCHQAATRYGELETEFKGAKLAHEKELEERDQKIQDLQDELKNANVLLHEAEKQSTEDALQKFCPAAATTNKILKSGKSLTEIFSVYVKATEELQSVKKENSILGLKIQEIIQEAEESALVFKRKEIDLQNAIETNEQLSVQLNKMMQEQAESKQERGELFTQCKLMENTIRRNKQEILDLSKQIVALLKQRQDNREDSFDFGSNVLDNMVVFQSVEELQEKNLILLSSVRELTKQMEEYEETKNMMDLATYEAKIENYNKRLSDMQATLDDQTKMMDRFIRQRDRYKTLYEKTVSKSRLSSSFNGSSLNNTGDNFMMDEDEVLPSNVSSHVSSEMFQSSIAEKDKKIGDLEEQIKQLQNSSKTLKEEYNDYRKEKQVNDKMMNEQFDSMRTELREMSTSNCKLLVQVRRFFCTLEMIVFL